MKINKVKFFLLGDSALTVSFGDEISPELNEKVLQLAYYIEKNPFRGFVEIVPAYNSLSLFYDVFEVGKEFSNSKTAFDIVKNFAENALRDMGETPVQKSRLIEIPVSFDEKFALDLDIIAAKNNISEDEVITIFTSKIYRVYFLGFLPGFAYMGEVDENIAAPRKDSPRKKITAGSVGIAGRQTGIYSLESPGGWQIIGKTEVELFTPKGENPTYLCPGDAIKFYSSNKR